MKRKIKVGDLVFTDPAVAMLDLERYPGQYKYGMVLAFHQQFKTYSVLYSDGTLLEVPARSVGFPSVKKLHQKRDL